MATQELSVSQHEFNVVAKLDRDSIACFVIAIAFLLRLVVAASTFFDPDEAFHYVLGNQHSFALAYRASLSSAHPPLLILLVYSLRWLGTSEIILRLPSVVAGTLSCWLAYKWLDSIADRNIALTGLVLLSFSPPLFALEAELRQYSLLLLFISAALYCFERSVQKDSWFHMALFSSALCLALTSHYGALLFAVSMGVYALLRFVQLRPTKRLLVIWISGQFVFLAIAIFFYKTHVPAVEQGISDSWLRKSFYHPGGHVVLFLLTNTYRFFQFVFGQPVVGSIMLLVFVLGLVALLRSGLRVTGFPKAGVVIAFALALSWGLALAGLYPFGGTRHSVFLLPFVALGIGEGLVFLLRARARLAPFVAAGALIFCSLFPVPAGPHITPPNQNFLLMRRAVEQARRSAKRNELALVDQQTEFPFRYYFCRDDVFPFGENPQNFSCGGFRVHKSGLIWDLSGEHLADDLRETRAAFSESSAARVFVFQTGWSVGRPSLLNKLNEAGCVTTRFGKNILTCQAQ